MADTDTTFDELEARESRRVGGRRLIYGVTTVVLTTMMVVAVGDGLSWWSAFGVRTETVETQGGGYELSVSYGSVSRPGLATPFEIVVEHPGGFAAPVTLAVTRDYLLALDENGRHPTPTDEVGRGDWVEWTFEPPAGERLVISFDARIEPALQSGRSGAVELLVDGEPVAAVEFRTRVLP